MPSNRAVAVAVAALVALSGCSALPGLGSGGQSTTAEPPDHHEFVLAADAENQSFDATVTVARDGETLFSRSLGSDGRDVHRALPSVERAGPYTVTVNTTFPAPGEGNRSARFTVDGDLGNATAVQVTPTAIRRYTYRLPRRPLEHPVGVYSNALVGDDDLPMDVTVAVTYRGEPAAVASASIPSDELVRVTDLNRTGVYHVRVRAPAETATATVVIPETDHHVRVILDADGGVETIEVVPAYRWN